MSVPSHILTANRRYAARFNHHNASSIPTRRIVILTCMDARLDPIAALGLKPGEAHILRNAGGRASDDAIRSIAISQQFLATNEILVIHHTDCATQRITNDQLRAKLKEDLGVDAGDVDLLTLDNLEQGIQQDVEALRSSPLVRPDTCIHGLVYDIRSGELKVLH